MRKYYQAALAVIAVISLVSLLIYRHEYNRLRYVLEVFDYFGRPGRVANCTNSESANSFLDSNGTLDTRLYEPLSSWQRLDDDLYIYSVYHMHDRKIRAIAFGKKDSVSDRRCAIYFEQETSPSLDTNFEYDVINSLDSSSYSGLRIVCSFDSDKTPVRVSFIRSLDDHVSNDSPVFPIKTQPRRFRDKVDDAIICVAPPVQKLVPASEMSGFLNFHRSIGVKRFVIYDFGIPSALDRRLRETLGFSYVSIPWNFPFVGVDYEATRGAVQADCLYRAHNKAKFIVTLSWDEYIVLMYHRTIIRLLADFDRSKMTAERYRLKSFTFCTQQPDDKFANATLLAFRKTMYDKRIGDDRRPVYVYNGRTLNQLGGYTRPIGKDLVRVHRYRFCKDFQATGHAYVHDVSISRFVESVKDGGLPVNYSDDD